MTPALTRIGRAVALRGGARPAVLVLVATLAGEAFTIKQIVSPPRWLPLLPGEPTPHGRAARVMLAELGTSAVGAGEIVALVALGAVAAGLVLVLRGDHTELLPSP